MSNSQEVQVINISTETGELTPFALIQNAPLTSEQKATIAARIERANKAGAKLKDVTPIYWEAKQGDKKTLAFLGFKVANKKDESGNITPSLLCRFNDGDREIVMAQVAIIDSMKSANFGDVFIIECTEAARGKAKRFTTNLLED